MSFIKMKKEEVILTKLAIILHSNVYFIQIKSEITRGDCFEKMYTCSASDVYPTSLHVLHVTF